MNYLDLINQLAGGGGTNDIKPLEGLADGNIKLIMILKY
jgi:hypothetical protein